MNSVRSKVDGEFVPVFIGGTGRSGTTILKRVLSTSHQIVPSEQELRLLTDPCGLVSLHTALFHRYDPYNIDFVLNNFVEMNLRAKKRSLLDLLSRGIVFFGGAPRRYWGLRYQWQNQSIDMGKIITELLDALNIVCSKAFWIGSKFSTRRKMYEFNGVSLAEARQAYERYLLALFSGVEESKNLILDDTPLNILWADKLIEIFPSAKFIWIRRRPKDVISSTMNMPWASSDSNINRNRVETLESNILEVFESLPKEKKIEVQFEAMIASPESEFKRLEEFLGVDDIRYDLVDLDKHNIGRGDTLHFSNGSR